MQKLNKPVSFYYSIFLFLILPSVFLWLAPIPVMTFAPILFFISLYLTIRNNWFIGKGAFILIIYAFLIFIWLLINGYVDTAIFIACGYVGLIFGIMLPHQNIKSLFEHINIYVYLIIFTFIGVFWHFTNLPILFQISNPSGDTSYFIPFTFYGLTYELIRPSSIYFEPGYFAFYLISFLYCRKLLGIEKGIDKYLALAGLITQSFTYITVLILYFLSFQKRSLTGNRLFNLFFVVIPLLLLILTSSYLDWVFARAYDWSQNPLSSIRYLHIREMFEFFRDPSILINGIHSCNLGADICPTIVGNPLAPLIRGGLVTYLPIFIGFTYILFLTILSANYNAFLAIVSLAVLMSAKPIYLQYPYSIMVGVFITCIIINIHKGKKI